MSYKPSATRGHQRFNLKFDPEGKFNLHGAKPPQLPVAAVKLGDVRIEIPADRQLHEIRDGRHFARDANLTKEVFQQFVSNYEHFPPRLSQLPEFLDELQTFVPKESDPDSPLFEFEAHDSKGHTIKDTIESPSETEARSLIEEMGYTITKFTVLKNAT